MSGNDRIILKRVVEGRRTETSPETTFDDFFEVFLFEQVLKRFDLSYEEIESGIVDGGDDAGLDGVFAFVNGTLIAEDTDFSAYKKDVTLDLYLIQAKTSPTFSEKPLNAFLDAVKDLLNLSRNVDDMVHYNADLRQAVGRFRRAYEDLAERFPKLRVWYIYGSFGDAEAVHEKVERKAGRLGETIAELFSDCEFRAQFLGAREILREARRQAPNSLQLRLADNALSTEGEGYLCLVNLRDYYEFITDDNGNLRKNIFESNVRDYQGRVEVNAGIGRTLRSAGKEDFWWLNNGVTVIANNGNIVGKVLTLEDPQIVNGLQTSTEIHNFFNENPRINEDARRVLVRVVATNDAESRDSIITATNSQTSLPAASLKAHDQIQRDIEDFFLGNGLYYDRRKNFYKNQGRPRDKIISIPYLAQAIVAIVLQRPDDSRARPSSLLKNDNVYREVFSPNYPIQLFLSCAQVMRSADSFIKSEQANLSQEERNNLRFHLAMYAAAARIGRIQYSAKDVSEAPLKNLDEDFLACCCQDVVEEFRRERKQTRDDADKVAKSKKFVSRIRRRLSERLR